jgi:hypothetical protein
MSVLGEILAPLRLSALCATAIEQDPSLNISADPTSKNKK